uniref:DnaJ homolog subfamily C member 16 n=1 Tax=Plectus sambesii TaxID=2011161 RepID=A0A914W4S8_9BILA
MILSGLLIFALFTSIAAINDPYATLGISKKATIKDIKRAYKEKAKEWHPDKNESPGANEKFVEINQAYELLSDPLRKERFDKFGTFDDPHEGHGGNGFHNGFDSFFSGFGGFGGFDAANSFFNKHRISMRSYQNTIIERSHIQPYIIFSYSNWCHSCHQLEPVWESVVGDLEPLGYGIGTINAQMEGNLMEKLRISRLPTIVVVVEGRVIHYRGPYQAKSIRMFARDVLPPSFMVRISDYYSLKRFLDLWSSTNKVSVLMFGDKEKPKLRYMLTAMKYSTFARFAYVHLTDEAPIQEMRDALSIRCASCESVLIFNEFPENGPVAHITSMKQLSPESINSLIENNKYLVLPRLSSQSHMDDLCPVSSRNPRRLCAILIVSDRPAEGSHVSAFRDFVLTHKYETDRIRFTYMYADKQRAFVDAFKPQSVNTKDEELSVDHRDVVIVWRVEQSKARYTWLRAAWSGKEADVNTSAQSLSASVDAILQGVSKLDDQTALQMLVDEFSPSWFTRLAKRTARLWETLLFHVTKDEFLPAISALGTLIVILLIGYGLNYAAVSEERKKKEELKKAQRPNGAATNETRNVPTKTPSTRSTAPQRSRMRPEYEQLVHELRAETFFGLVRLLKPGCRSLIVLIDEDTKDLLLPEFCRHIWPWRNNKTLSFGYIMVNKNLPWFRKLLEHTLPVDEGDPTSASAVMYKRLKNINPRQTVGTVLAICGWKLYFCMYHPMHGKSTASGRRNFMGFDDSDYSSSDSEPSTKEETEALKKKNLKMEEVLSGMPNWLDRLFEGSVTRYYVPEWPDNLK